MDNNTSIVNLSLSSNSISTKGEILVNNNSIFSAIDKNDLNTIRNFIISSTMEAIQIIDKDKSILQAMCYSNKCKILLGTIEIFKSALGKEKETEFINYINLKTTLKGYTAIHFAANRRSLEEIKLLIEYGADKDVITKDGFSVLHMACEGQNFPALVFFVEKYNMDIKLKDKNGNTPLHWAAYANFNQGVQYLLIKGAQINAQDNSGKTILHTALMNYKTTLIENLIAKGADYKNIKDNYERNCIDYANGMKNKEIDEMISKYDLKLFKIIQNVFIFSVYFIIFIAILFCLLPWINNIEIAIVYFVFIGLVIICYIVMIFLNSYTPKGQMDDKFSLLKSIENNEAFSTYENLCLYCKIFKTKGMRHCFLCNRCINGHVRHSHIYGQCIGRKNIKASMINLFLHIITNIYFIIISIISLTIKRDISNKDDVFTFKINNIVWLYMKELKRTVALIVICLCFIIIGYQIFFLVKEVKNEKNIPKDEFYIKKRNGSFMTFVCSSVNKDNNKSNEVLIVK